MTKDKALKMAIEALDTLMIEKGSIYQKALEVCKEALEQPAQEPIHNCPNCNSLFTKEIHSIPASSWQGLSDDEIDKIDQGVQQWWVDAIYPMFENKLVENYELIENYELLFARAIERALKVKNT